MCKLACQFCVLYSWDINTVQLIINYKDGVKFELNRGMNANFVICCIFLLNNYVRNAELRDV